MRCHRCGTRLSASSAFAAPDNLGAADAPVERMLWRIVCPVDRRHIPVSGPEARCPSCPYEGELFDSLLCVPQGVVDRFVLPDEADADRPLLFLEELEAEQDDDLIAHPTENPPRVVGWPLRLEGDAVLGRTGSVEPERFVNDRYISEQHLQVTLRNGRWYLTLLSEVCEDNYLDGTPLVRAMKCPVHDGALLQLADRMFRLRVRGCGELAASPAGGLRPMQNRNALPSAPDASTEPVDLAPAAWKWVVVCPCCRRSYEVGSAEDRVQVCESCDEFDREQIAFARAVKRSC